MRRAFYPASRALFLAATLAGCTGTLPGQVVCNEIALCSTGYCCGSAGVCVADGDPTCSPALDGGASDAGQADAGSTSDAGEDAGLDGGPAALDAGNDAGPPSDAGEDAGGDAGPATPDAGADGGTDAGVDGGSLAVDAGVDAGVIAVDAGVDAGTDAGHDAGPVSGSDGGADAGTDAGPSAHDAGTDAGSAAQDAGSSTCGDAGISAPPSHLTYATNPAVFTKGVTITTDIPSVVGCDVTSFAITPALPPGLSLSLTTGALSGTPSAVSPATSYTVTASNSNGSTQATLQLTVRDVAPFNLQYQDNPAVYQKGAQIPDNSPSHNGGAVVSYAISPALPAGLSFSTVTGVIAGTATVLSPEATYTVTATNSGGSTSTGLAITVNDVPPSLLEYPTNPLDCTNGVAITADTPTYEGGTVTLWSVAPSLPAGLALDVSTGIVSGTPSGVFPSAGYTVTATNSGGSAQISLSITVNDVAPSHLTYAVNPAVYTVQQAIANDTPSSGGGAVVLWGVSPMLPTGLSLSMSTGVISGTPVAVTAFAAYTVTAINSGGSTQATVHITVNDVAPSGLSYPTNPLVATVGAAISADLPDMGGGAVISWAISPALPAGLGFNTTSGVVSGTPSVLSPATTYTVTATNSGGSTTAQLSVAVVAGSYSTSGLNGTVTVGAGYACAIVSSGVVCWGDNYYGELGNNSTISSTLPVPVVGLTGGVQAVAAGNGYTCALVNGGVQCWGGNGGGSLGNNSTLQSNVPVQVQGLTSGVEAITAGAGYACAVVNGGAWCWGYNDVGQLGDDSTVQSNIPVQVTGLTSGVQAISASYHTCALVNGGVWCWGDNGSGQLGNNSFADSSVPVQVIGLSAGVEAISAANVKSCAVVSGAVKCWGDNTLGDLGNNSTTNSPVPVQVHGLTSGVQAIATGSVDGTALVNGALWWWGETSGSHVPVSVSGVASGAQAVAMSFQTACALVNGAVRCWGDNESGQLGNNSTVSSNSAVQVTGLTSGVEAVVAGWYTCAIVNGGAQCWGGNSYGDLGNNSTNNSSSPVQVQGLSSGVQALAVGNDHACAIVNGGVQCWGDNGYGKLGNNSGTSSPVPVQVLNLTGGAQAIAASQLYTCALVNGGVQCWGTFVTGNDTFEPVPVSGWTSGVQAIAAGDNLFCALVNGGVQCIGTNTDGELGNNSTVSGSYLNVVQVSGLTSGAEALAVGAYGGCAVVNGGVQCWGAGPLGDGSGATSSIPVLSNITGGAQSVSANQYGNCALVNGGVQCWGYNAVGELGNNSTAETLVPVAVSGATRGVQALTSGFGEQSCLLSGGSVLCWGENSNGDLGNPGGNALFPVAVTPWAP